MTDVLIPFNGSWLVLSAEQLQEALQRGQVAFGAATSLDGAEAPPERVLDAEGMQSETGIPASWYLEAARQGRIPHIRAGKYVRFRLGETLDALSAGARPGDRLTSTTKMRAANQSVEKPCYRAATKIVR
jgi:hypothetical protein